MECLMKKVILKSPYQKLTAQSYLNFTAAMQKQDMMNTAEDFFDVESILGIRGNLSLCS